MIEAWYWRSLPSEKRTGSEVFATLFRPTNPSGIATLLESPYPTPIDHPQFSRYSICAGAPRLVDGIPQMWTPEVGEVFPFLEKLLQQEVGRDEEDEGDKVVFSSPPRHLPFTGGWLGWLGYDVAW